RSGGWLEYRNRQNNALEHRNANDGRLRLFRIIGAWRPADGARVTVSWFSSKDAWDSRVTGYTLPTDGPVLEPEACYDSAGHLVRDCAGADVSYRRPALTLPALPDLGRHTTVDPALAPSKTLMDVGALTLDYQLGSVNLRSITSYIEDISRTTQAGGGTQNRIRGTRQLYEGFSFAAQNSYAGLAYAPQAYTSGLAEVENRRYGFSQEFRATSWDAARGLGWVAGAYYANHRATQAYDLIYPDLDLLVRSLIGISALQRYGAPYQYQGQPIGWSAKYQTIKDKELAVFGEVNRRITDRMTVIAGVRVSRLAVRYFEMHYGPASGGNDPSKVPGGITGPENHAESAVAPKVGVQYQFTDNDMVYATVSKGFRAGGVNASIPETLCGATLARYGETVLTVPKTYKSDTVWSYEAGAKVRVLDNRLQLNGSVYRIDWSNLQTNVTIPTPCVGNFIGNAGKARSQGFELEAQARLFEGLTANLALGYTDAKYIGDTIGLGGGPGFLSLPVALDGQRIAVAPWTVQVGIRYDHEIADGLRGYVRADARYIRHYEHTAVQTFGNSAYSPTAEFPDTSRVNLRLGLERGPLDVNVFVNNLFNSRKGDVTGGLTSCPVAGGPACLSGFYSPYYTVAPASPPRQFGLQVAYRY
ncbi:MAG TPA: TonB-dependent receptor, partial [Phenylobacterium sp.]|nr:TonB-dependent receptor [Phenylobacterium sp.]